MGIDTCVGEGSPLKVRLCSLRRSHELGVLRKGGDLLRSQWPLTGISLPGLCLSQMTHVQAGEPIPRGPRSHLLLGHNIGPPSLPGHLEDGGEERNLKLINKNVYKGPQG